MSPAGNAPGCSSGRGWLPTKPRCLHLSRKGPRASGCRAPRALTVASVSGALGGVGSGAVGWSTPVSGSTAQCTSGGLAGAARASSSVPGVSPPVCTQWPGLALGDKAGKEP